MCSSLFSFFSYSGEWKIFTGNEIGILLAWWVWDQYHTAHPDVDPAKCVMLNSTVSSKMLSAMAKKEGIKYDVRAYYRLLLPCSLRSSFDNSF